MACMVEIPRDDTDWSYGEWGKVSWNIVGDDEIIVVCACTPFGKPDKDWRPE